MDMFLSMEGHNPYFNRWFSAMAMEIFVEGIEEKSQSLF